MVKPRPPTCGAQLSLLYSLQSLQPGGLRFFSGSFFLAFVLFVLFSSFVLQCLGSNPGPQGLEESTALLNHTLDTGVWFKLFIWGHRTGEGIA